MNGPLREHCSVLIGDLLWGAFNKIPIEWVGSHFATASSSRLFGARKPRKEMNLVVKDLFDTLLQFVSDGHKKRRASSLSAIFAISGAVKAQPPMGPPSAADVDKKLDDMAKKDASTAVNFFRQGVVNLKQAFGAMLSSAEGQLDDREASVSYSTVLEAKLVAELLKNKDHPTVKKFLFGAGEKFRLSRAKATEAFSNEVLPTNDRVTSAKIQIAATILEHVDSLGDAVQECVHYLENVHALTAVKRDMKVGLRPDSIFFFETGA